MNSASDWGVTSFEHEDDVGLVYDFVLHVDVIVPLPFLRLVDSCRGRVKQSRQDVDRWKRELG
jgi:hypothetical protein